MDKVQFMNEAVTILADGLKELAIANNRLRKRAEELKRQVSDYKAALHAARHESIQQARNETISKVLDKYRDNLS